MEIKILGCAVGSQGEPAGVPRRNLNKGLPPIQFDRLA